MALSLARRARIASADRQDQARKVIREALAAKNVPTPAPEPLAYHHTWAAWIAAALEREGLLK